jgi:hypothetical protein
VLIATSAVIEISNFFSSPAEVSLPPCGKFLLILPISHPPSSLQFGDFPIEVGISIDLFNLDLSEFH